MSEVWPAVITTMTFAQKILWVGLESCVIPLPEVDNLGLKSKFYFENGLLRSVSKVMYIRIYRGSSNSIISHKWNKHDKHTRWTINCLSKWLVLIRMWSDEELAEIKGKDYSRNFNKPNLRPALVKFTHHHMTFSNDFICCEVTSVFGNKKYTAAW